MEHPTCPVEEIERRQRGGCISPMAAESAIAALRQTGLHRCCNFNCDQGRNCPTRQACELPDEPGNDLKDPAKAIVYALTIAVALLGVAAALFS